MSYGNPVGAIDYVAKAIRLLCQPGLRRFVIVPLLVNIVVFIAITAVLINTYGGILTDAANSDNWWAFFAWLVWIIIGLVVLIVYGYTFNIITTMIAAPFYGVLAEKIEERVTGRKLPAEALGNLVARTFKRELVKLWYFISRGLLVFLVLVVLFFIPLVGFAGLFISGCWAAWCMTVQYTDYSADNHQTPFSDMRSRLRKRPLTTFSLGGLIMLGSMVPIVNIFVMPVAVASATLYWLNEVTDASPTLQLR